MEMLQIQFHVFVEVIEEQEAQDVYVNAVIGNFQLNPIHFTLFFRKTWHQHKFFQNTVFENK